MEKRFFLYTKWSKIAFLQPHQKLTSFKNQELSKYKIGKNNSNNKKTSEQVAKQKKGYSYKMQKI